MVMCYTSCLFSISDSTYSGWCCLLVFHRLPDYFVISLFHSHWLCYRLPLISLEIPSLIFRRFSLLHPHSGEFTFFINILLFLPIFHEHSVCCFCRFSSIHIHLILNIALFSQPIYEIFWIRFIFHASNNIFPISLSFFEFVSISEIVMVCKHSKLLKKNLSRAHFATALNMKIMIAFFIITAFIHLQDEKKPSTYIYT